MIELLRDVFIGTLYLLGTLGIIAVVLFIACLILGMIRYLRKEGK